MGAVSDRLRVLGAPDKQQEIQLVKQYLRISHDEDDLIIRQLLDGAKDEADAYLNNDFVDSDGNEKPIPGTIAQWVLGAVARSYELRMNGIRTHQQSGLESITLAEGEIDYTRLDRFRLLPGL